MAKKNFSEEELDELLTRLPQSARSPQGKFSAENSFDMLEKRLPKKAKRLSFLKYVAATAAVLIVALIGVNNFLGTKAPEMITLSTTDKLQEVTLPDGTTITLSHYSTLTYPKDFDGDIREVTLLGEGYFEVSKDKSRPFIVKAQDIQIKVLGTHFNVEAYANDTEIRTTLLEGSVAVSKMNNPDHIILKPNETAVYSKESAKLISQANMNAQDEIGWKNGVFIFNDIPLHDIVRDLSNYYNITIEISNEKLKNYKLTARFDKGENLDEMLSLLQIVGNFGYTKTDNTIIIKPN